MSISRPSYKMPLSHRLAFYSGYALQMTFRQSLETSSDPKQRRSLKKLFFLGRIAALGAIEDARLEHNRDLEWRRQMAEMTSLP